MNRATAKALRDKLNSILEEHGIEGYEIHAGNASFDDTQVTFKVEVREQGAGSPEERDLETFANISDIDTNKIANQQGKTFSLVGYKTRARKNPWIVQDMKSGTKYVINDMTAKRWFGKDVA
tara:strand:- start:72 stop:437 length:366 start_codon:yes stop_codon:yes gene_type:complete